MKRFLNLLLIIFIFQWVYVVLFAAYSFLMGVRMWFFWAGCMRASKGQSLHDHFWIWQENTFHIWDKETWHWVNPLQDFKNAKKGI